MLCGYILVCDNSRVIANIFQVCITSTGHSYHFIGQGRNHSSPDSVQKICHGHLSLTRQCNSLYHGTFPANIPQNLLYKTQKIPHIEARCYVNNENVVGAAPTGDAPTTFEGSTILLPTKVPLILDV